MENEEEKKDDPVEEQDYANAAIKTGDKVYVVERYDTHTDFLGNAIEPEYQGEVFEVHSVSWPFVLASVPVTNMPATFDLRKIRLAKANQSYWDAAVKLIQIQIDHEKEERTQRQFSMAQARMTASCPVCSGPLREQMVMGEKGFNIICTNCGFRGYRDGN